MTTAEFASALLTLWGLEGGECWHGHGLAEDCPEEDCVHNEIRPALRAADQLVGDGEPEPSPPVDARCTCGPGAVRHASWCPGRLTAATD